MNVVIMQPFYLFLRKHFHQIYRADTYIFYDDVQFIRRWHHNRNRIKSPDGLFWLTVPVKKKGRYEQLIKDVEIDNEQNWRKKHWQNIQRCYATAPFFRDYADFFEECYQREWTKLCELNIHLIIGISRFLGIENVRFLRSSELGIANDNPTQRLIDICEHLGATRYIIGTRAKEYMEEQRWKRSKVVLEWYEPKYPPYPQLGGEFVEYCAIVDLLFSCGPESGKYIWGKHFLSYQSRAE